MPSGVDIGHDVGRLDERALAQRADRAAVAVGAHHVELEALLVEPDPRVAGGVRADVWTRNQATGLHVLDGQAGLELDDLRGRVVRGHEHRGDNEVLARRQRAEVHERRLELVGGAERAVVGLVDRTCAIGGSEQRAGLVERVGVRIVERRRQRQRGGSTLTAAAMASALE
jgi:hypothetical protein